MSVIGAIALHAAVTGTSIDKVELISPAGQAQKIAWADLATTKIESGKWLVRFTAPPASALEIPPCGGRQHVTIGGSAACCGSS